MNQINYWKMIPKESLLKVLIKALTILNHLVIAQENYAVAFGSDAKNKKDRWMKSAVKFLEQYAEFPDYFPESGKHVPLPEPEELKPHFYVEAGQSEGNAILWWKEEQDGCTTDLRKAQIFTQKEAEKMLEVFGGRAWPSNYIRNQEAARKLIIDSRLLETECCLNGEK